MNLVQAANDLKNLSDQQLAQVSQTSAEVPPYLVMAEMQRRDAMRKQYVESAQQGRGGKTVAEELYAKFGSTPPPAMPQGGPQQGAAQQGNMNAGLMAAAPQPPQGPQAPSMQPRGPMQFAKGGLLALADGSQDQPVTAQPQQDQPITSVDDYNKLYPTQSIQDVMSQIQAMQGRDPYAAIAAELAKQSDKDKNRKLDKWGALAKAGFAMAAAPTSSLGVAIGQAGLTGLNDLQRQKDEQRRDYMNALSSRLAVAQGQGQRNNQGIAAATDVYRSNVGRSDTMAQVVEGNRRAAKSDQTQRDLEQMRIGQQQAELKAHGPVLQAQAAYYNTLSQSKDPTGDVAQLLKVAPMQAAVLLGEKMDKSTAAMLSDPNTSPDMLRGMAALMMSRAAQRNSLAMSTAAARAQAALMRNPMQQLQADMINEMRQQGMTPTQIMQKLGEVTGEQKNESQLRAIRAKAYESLTKDPVVRLNFMNASDADKEKMMQSEINRLMGVVAPDAKQQTTPSVLSQGANGHLVYNPGR